MSRREEKIPDMGQRASECSSVWQNGTKGGAQNSQTECLLARLARLLAIQLRLAHPNGGGRRREATEPAPLVSDKQENNAHAHLPPLRRHTNKPKEEEKEGGTRRETGYRGDTSFVSEWIWVESASQNVELFLASIIGLAAVDTKPGPSHSNRVQYGRGCW